MATDKVIVSVLDVGQGQGTFVEVYDNGDLTNALLFDLGSAKSKYVAGWASIKYVVDKLCQNMQPRLDYLSLSHKDRDHVNLIMELIEAVKKESGSDLQIDEIRYGGAKYWYSNNLITELEKICKSVKGFKLRHSSYESSGNKWTPIWSKNGVSVFIIIANIPTDEDAMDFEPAKKKAKPDSELANSVSIVSSILYSGNEFFINGDATFITIGELIKMYAHVGSWTESKMVTLPHHGSRKTTLGLSVSTDDASAKATKVVDTFAKKIGAKTVTASAEFYGKYNHPSYDVMMRFEKYADQAKKWYSDPELEASRHYLTTYLDVDFNNGSNVISHGYKTFETTIDVYSTLYYTMFFDGEFKAPPINPVSKPSKIKKSAVFPYGAQWQYTMQNNTTKLSRGSNRLSTVLVESLPDERIAFTRQKLINEATTGFMVRPPARIERIQILKRLKVIA